MVDEWNGFAYLLAELIEKHASEININDLQEPCVENEKEKGRISCNYTNNSVDNDDAA